MARDKQFWVEQRKRKYNGTVRDVWRACWIDDMAGGAERTAERKDWTKKEALDFAGEQWLKVKGGTFVKKTTATIDDAIELWLADLEERRQLWLVQKRKTKQTISGAYFKNMQYLASTILSPYFGKLRPAEIDKKHVERWARLVVTRGEVTPHRVDYAVKRLSILLDIAVDHGCLRINPLRKIRLNLPDVEPATVVVPEDADIAAMLQLLEPDYCKSGESEVLFSALRMAIFMVAFAGLRPNEASALHWEDVDLDRREIYQHRGYTAEEGHKEGGKTRASKRLIDILPQLHAEFLAYQQRVAEITPMYGRAITGQALAERNADPASGLVLCNAYIGTLGPQSIGHHWRKLRTRVERDLSKFTLYSLRHYAGSIWLRDGMSIARVSAMMGHTDIELTQRVYIKVLREMDEDRLRTSRQIGEGLDRRYRALGLSLASTPVPMLGDAASIIVDQPALPPTAVVEIVPEVLPQAWRDLRAAVESNVLDMFERGMKPPIIARKLNVAKSTVLNIINDRNTVVTTPDCRHAMTPEERATRDAEARRLAEEEGLSYREIAPRVGMRVGTLRTLASRQGWKAKRKRECWAHNHDEFKGSEDLRARTAESMRRHRERQKLIAAGEDIPNELQKRPSIPGPIRKPRAKMSKEEHLAKRRAWKQSESGKASVERYRQSDANKAAQHRYKTSKRRRAGHVAAE